MKKLIVSGCSWCDYNFKSVFHPELDCSWPKWPEMLAEKLEMECVNLGKCGSGSEYIYNSLLEIVTHTSDVGLVIAAWSKSERRDWQRPNNTWTHEIIDQRGDNEYWIQRHLRYYYSFQVLCEYLQVPYKQVQMLSPTQYGDGTGVGRKKALVSFGTNPMIDLINENNFVGWPMFRELGGIDIQNKVVHKKDRRYEISDEDAHPNAQGQKLIADFMYENI
jgi:hypothetical protein